MRTRESLLSPPAPATILAEPAFPPGHERVYARALDALEEHGVPFLVGGALAVNAYTGIWRWTKDLDLFVAEPDVPRVRRALEGAGLEWMTIYESWLAKALDGDVFVDVIHRSANGLYSVDATWFEHAGSMRLLGRDRPVISPEDLLLCKIFVAARNRFDGADVVHVLFRAHGRIDWERLLERAEQHAELLLAYVHLYRWTYPAFRDAVPDAVVARLRERAERETVLAPPFRGRLLDFASFGVDVEALGLPDPQENLPSG